MRPCDMKIRRGYQYLALKIKDRHQSKVSSRHELISDLVHDFEEIERIELHGILAVDVGSSPFK
jgi:hypothetical protein